MDKDKIISKCRAYERHLGIAPSDMRDIDTNDLNEYLQGLKEDYRVFNLTGRIIKQVRK